MINNDIKNYLVRLTNTIEEILKTVKLHAEADNEDIRLRHYKILKRFLDKRPDGCSAYYVEKHRLEALLDKEPDSVRTRVQNKLNAFDGVIQKAIKETGMILPGRSCSDFVISCNSLTGRIRMRVFHNGDRNTFEEERNFVISPSRDKPWRCIKSLVEADHDGADLGKSNLTSIFNGDAESIEFRRYIHPCIGLGSKGNHRYVLKQYHNPHNKTKKSCKNS